MAYRFQIASDMIRDGLGLELINTTNQVCAEVFRCDADNTLKMSLFGDDLPFVQIENLVLIARKELARYEDGTPLPPAIPLERS
ncbi:hypothetical protein OKW98_25715 [Pseudomonas sp. KU26590]|uniref:hypothetical protein n=1 Tax=Pseudomonas sp. KU26590 TaxID=2991051 RepID=UPI00223CB471|nr:hypothetical protein [Pseudomonas sp. KU26590]UZJ59885.1 hypothetical protein OKW98_25715 [Pseudomonas sp. KU26590]